MRSTGCTRPPLVGACVIATMRTRSSSIADNASTSTSPSAALGTRSTRTPRSRAASNMAMRLLEYSEAAVRTRSPSRHDTPVKTETHERVALSVTAISSGRAPTSRARAA